MAVKLLVHGVTMRSFVLALGCVACMGNARRVTTPSLQQQASNFAEQADLNAIATLLLASSPRSAFAAAAQGPPTRQRSSSTRMATATPTKVSSWYDAGIRLGSEEPVAEPAKPVEKVADWSQALTEAEEKLRKVIAAILDVSVSKVTDDATFASLGVQQDEIDPDWMFNPKWLELIQALETELDLEIVPSRYFDMKTVGQVVDYFKQQTLDNLNEVVRPSPWYGDDEGPPIEMM